MEEMKKKFLEWYDSRYTPIMVNCSEEMKETHKHGAWEGYKACIEDMKNPQSVASPDKHNPYLQSDRNRKEIIAVLAESEGKEDSLSFSAKEVRGLLSQIIHLEERVERLARKL